MRMKFVPACFVWFLCVACGSGGSETPPIAAASLSVGTVMVPLGSPMEATFKFEVKEAVPALRQDGGVVKDYRVFVHMLDANENLLWQDDHYPPVPTSEWSPGETIEYARTIIVPIYPYVGKMVIRLGLYSELDGSRLPLDGEHVGQDAYQVATLQLLHQSESIVLTPKSGWNTLEVAASNASVEWRWTKGNAVMSFNNPKQNSLLYLDIEGRPGIFETPQVATISIGSKVLAVLELAEPGRILHRFPLSADDLGSEEVVDLEISTDKTFTPGLLGDGMADDMRELGARVFRIAVVKQQLE